MFAVVRTGGKQYKVAAKDRLEVAKIDAKEGAEKARWYLNKLIDSIE